MKVGSREYYDALRKYKPSNKSEEIIIELLLVPTDDYELLDEVIDKIGEELTAKEFDKLDVVIRKIKEELGFS